MTLLRSTIFALLFALSGCASLPQQSNQLAADTHKQTAKITSAANEANDHISAALKELIPLDSKAVSLETDADQMESSVQELDEAIVVLGSQPTTQQVRDSVQHINHADRNIETGISAIKLIARDFVSAIEVAEVELQYGEKSLGKIPTPAKKIDSNADAQASIANQLQLENAAIKASLRYRIGGWLETIAWVLGICLVVHYVCIGLAIVLPIPYGPACAIVAKFVNPLGWGNWLLSHIEITRVQTALTVTDQKLTNATDAVAEMVSDTPANPAAHVAPYTAWSPSTQQVIQSAVPGPAGAIAAAPFPVAA